MSTKLGEGEIQSSNPDSSTGNICGLRQSTSLPPFLICKMGMRLTYIMWYGGHQSL